MLDVVGEEGTKRQEVKPKYEPLSREFLLARGHCCKSGCLNCPYGFKKKANKDEETTPASAAEKW